MSKRIVPARSPAPQGVQSRPGGAWQRALLFLGLTGLIALGSQAPLLAADGREPAWPLAAPLVASDAGIPDAGQRVAGGPTADEGREALGAAADERERAYALGGEAREAALIAAAASFGALADKATLSIEVRAEAAFRAGELLRARKLVGESAIRFDQALRLGGALPVSLTASPDASAAGSNPGAGVVPALESGVVEARMFAARGLLELAHIERRADRFEEAMALYERLSEDFPDQPRQGSHGATWATKLLIRLGRHDDAVAGVAVFATRYPGYPLDLVRNAGAVAEALVDKGRQEEARALVDSVSQVLAPLGEAEDSRVNSALAAVRVTVWGRDR